MVSKADKVGTIFKIKRFSVHDGPGIRTSIFLKGCPLCCIWCHSPEGLDQKISIWHNKNICIACEECVKACPENALELRKSGTPEIIINCSKCNVSGNCVSVCPTNAIQFTGYEIPVSQIISEIEKDTIYYEKSGGGVTLTGGEPLYQPEFSAEILKECKKSKIHTAIETSLYCEREILEMISHLPDLFIVDLKIFDADNHKRFTGKSNEIIKDNFSFLAGRGKNIIVRIPLVENITNTENNLKTITDFVKEADENIPIDKISFNPLAENNYKKMGINFLLK
jgi:pyruvate formate lyase activating enzyme